MFAYREFLSLGRSVPSVDCFGVDSPQCRAPNGLYIDHCEYRCPLVWLAAAGTLASLCDRSPCLGCLRAHACGGQESSRVGPGPVSRLAPNLSRVMNRIVASYRAAPSFLQRDGSPTRISQRLERGPGLEPVWGVVVADTPLYRVHR